MGKLVVRLLCSILFLCVFSCEKSSVETLPSWSSTQLIEQARTYFNAQIIAPNPKARFGVDGNNSFKSTDWQPQWKRAVAFHYQDSEVVEVPMLYKGKELNYMLTIPGFSKKETIRAGNGVTKALFFYHKDKTMNGYLMRLILDDEYYQQKRTTHKSLSLQTLGEDYSGLVLLSDWNGRLLDAYRLENGKVRFTTKRRDSKSPKNGRLAGCQEVYNCYTIHGYNYFGSCSPDVYENCGPNNWCGACEIPPYYWSYDVCMTEVVCYSNPVTEPNPGGSSGDPSDENLNRITNNLATPCLKNVMSKVQNAQFNSQVQNILRRFNASTTLNFTIKEGNLNNDDRNAETVGNVITLNNVALANASQEFIAKVIYHEVLHVYLGGSLNSDHQTMATNYVDPLTQTLTSLFPNLSFNDAQALSWSGLKDTNAWASLGQAGKDQIFGIATQYKNLNNGYNHQYGTSCN